jgi:hypothetical protein
MRELGEVITKTALSCGQLYWYVLCEEMLALRSLAVRLGCQLNSL